VCIFVEVQYEPIAQEEEAMSDLRIVSLLPSATEIVCALGLGEQLVGVSHCCDFPEEVRGMPVLTESVVDPSLPSAEIDRLTKEALGRGESLYRLNEALLRELQPDVVITQALCDVCAISFPSVARAVGQLDRETQLISLEPGCIEDIFLDIERVGQAISRSAEAHQLISDSRQRLLLLQAQLHGVKPPRVLTLEWFEPAFYGGHWVPEQVSWGGGVSVVGEAYARSEGIGWDSIAALDPDVIVCMPCGYDTQQCRRLLGTIERSSYFCELRAVVEGRVWCVDANSFFSRPGPRVMIGAEVMGHVLHPERVSLPSESEAPLHFSR
jgi:iron complex transport system substrate-binding protein